MLGRGRFDFRFGRRDGGVPLAAAVRLPIEVAAVPVEGQFAERVGGESLFTDASDGELIVAVGGFGTGRLYEHDGADWGDNLAPADADSLVGVCTGGGDWYSTGWFGSVLARDKALYVGHPVAAVCATDPHVAEDAVELIEVEYEPLPFVQDVREAMAKDAPILHEDLRTREAAPLSQEQQEGATNVAAHLRFGQGDPEPPPGRVFALLRPDRGHLGEGVALDHVG